MAGYACVEDSSDASAAERDQAYKIVAGERADWVRSLRELLGVNRPEPRLASARCRHFRGSVGSPSFEQDRRNSPAQAAWRGYCFASFYPLRAARAK